MRLSEVMHRDAVSVSPDQTLAEAARVLRTQRPESVGPDTLTTTGINSRFQGPYSAGPPPGALEVTAPDLDRFGVGELRRMLVIQVVLTMSIQRSLARKLFKPWKKKRWASAVSEGVVDGFTALGPTFVKLGQVIASSPGLFPAPMADACLRCLDDVPPFDAATARRLIEKDLGRPPTELFRFFDDRPVSAASIAQVHPCVLPDGRDAVIKLQRPNIARRMNTDLRIIYRLAKQLEYTKIGKTANVTAVVEDLHRVTNQELNFALEAYRQSLFRDRIGYFGDNTLITAPEVHWDYCGPSMICMERMVGVPMDQIETIKARGIDGQAVLRQFLKVWMEALMVHGPFHGDVHAGNIWVLEDGRGAYLDFGIMGELPHEWKELCKALFYSCMVDRDFTRVVRAYKRIGVLPPDADEEQLGQMAAMTYGPLLDQTLGETSVGQLFKHSMSMVEAAGVSLPKELVLVSKQLLYIERYSKLLAPDYHLAKDLYQIKNIFPDAAADRAALPDIAFSHRPQSAAQEERLSRAS